MSGNSVIEDVGLGLTAAALTVATGGTALLAAGIGAAAAGGAAIAQNNLKPPSPNLQSPDALSATPTLAQTNTQSLQTQLAKERAQVSTSSYLGMTGGLLDQPTTSSRVLLGN